MLRSFSEFQRYKALNESFGPITLGLGKVSALGLIGAQGANLEEGKKKGCKKCMDVDDDEPGDEEEEAGVEVVKGKKDDDKCGKCGSKECECGDKEGEEEADDKPTFFQKKKSKKKMQSEGLFGKKLGKAPPPELGHDDLGDDLGGDEKLGNAPDDLGGDDLGDGDEDDLGGKPMGKKKPPVAPEAEPPMFMKKRSRKGMTKEQSEWWNSVEGQMGANPDPRFFDGFTEIKDVQQAIRPGDVGWAPNGKVGSWF